MSSQSFEKLFKTDVISKRERVERTLNHEPVDRVALHDQLSYNPSVISLYTGKKIQGFNYTLEDIGIVIQNTLDACFPAVAPLGTDQFTDADGFIYQNDNWYRWTVERPFHDIAGAKQYLLQKTKQMQTDHFDAQKAHQIFHDYVKSQQRLIGETVFIDISSAVGLCTCWSNLGIELFVYLYQEEPNIISDFIETYVTCEIRRVHAVADPILSPVILIADDFASKSGPIFSPKFLSKEHFPRLKRLTEAWHSHGLKVIYHSDGNWKLVIPNLIDCGVDGFYCLEPAVGMDIIELKKTYPHLVWMGGVDGVDLMERGTPVKVSAAVSRQIRETDALKTGGLFIDTSSEINPPIKPENFRAMVETVGTIINPDFS